LTGYAITRAGAHKLLYTLGYLGPADAVDIQILNMCSRRELRTVWVVPPLIGAWKLHWAFDSDTGANNETERAQKTGKPGKGNSNIGDKSARKEVARLWGVGRRGKGD
jgi:hypothetical protein